MMYATDEIVTWMPDVDDGILYPVTTDMLDDGFLRDLFPNRQEGQRKTENSADLVPFSDDTATELIIERLTSIGAEADRMEMTATQYRWTLGRGFNILRARVNHGDWLPFLRERFPQWSERTIRNWMTLATSITYETAAEIPASDLYSSRHWGFWNGEQFSDFAKTIGELTAKVNKLRIRIESAISTYRDYGDDTVNEAAYSLALKVVPEAFRLLAQNAGEKERHFQKRFSELLGR